MWPINVSIQARYVIMVLKNFHFFLLALLPSIVAHIVDEYTNLHEIEVRKIYSHQ